MKHCLALCLLSLLCGAQAQPIKINPGKYSDYYHMQYELKAGQYSLNANYGFNPGGQFEVLVPKEYFPIAAPNCNKNIIIRMPYSNQEAKKRALYNKLLASESVLVTLELNPYMKVLTKQPLRIELQYCNVFFRHRAGDYFDKL